VEKRSAFHHCQGAQYPQDPAKTNAAYTPKNASFFGQHIRIFVVNCYWVATPEGASLFRPTYLGICGGLMFGVDCALPAHKFPKNIKNVGWKSRRRLPPKTGQTKATPITCQNKRCLHTEKRIICRPAYSYNCGELLLTGNAGRRCAFPAYNSLIIKSFPI